jgi:hypothetical protein
MQLGAIAFIIPWKALHMFRVLFTPIIRSVLKLHAVIGTIVYRYGVRSSLLQDDQKLGAYSTMP